MNHSKFKLVGLLLPALLIAGAGCGGDDDGGTSGPDTSVYGTYALETVEGVGLPYVVLQVGEDKIEITGGSARINNDNTWSSAITIRATENGVVNTTTATGAGTYTRSGNSFDFFNPGDGTHNAGSVSGDVLTIIDEDATYTFRK